MLSSNNLDDYQFLLDTIHTDDDKHKLFKIIQLDINNTDTDGDIIVGYRRQNFAQ